MRQLPALHRSVARRPITIDELVGLLDLDYFDAIEAQAREERERFRCPLVVPDYESFKDVLFAYFLEYHRTFYHTDPPRIIENNPSSIVSWRQAAILFAQEHLGALGLRNAERASITGRDGGLPAVIDALRDGIVKRHSEMWVQYVFAEMIPPSDDQMRVRLAQALLQKYASLLAPHTEVLPPAVLGADLQSFVHGFVKLLHDLRRIVRY